MSSSSLQTLSPYEWAMDYLRDAINNLAREGFIQPTDVYPVIVELDRLPASEVMRMYKAWREADIANLTM